MSQVCVHRSTCESQIRANTPSVFCAWCSGTDRQVPQAQRNVSWTTWMLFVAWATEIITKLNEINGMSKKHSELKTPSTLPRYRISYSEQTRLSILCSKSLDWGQYRYVRNPQQQNSDRRSRAEQTWYFTGKSDTTSISTSITEMENLTLLDAPRIYDILQATFCIRLMYRPIAKYPPSREG